MRLLLATVSLAALIVGAAQAETHIFLVANDSDGYGVDRCLAAGAQCGAAVATAYCKSRSFAQAASFRHVEPDEISGATPTGSGCRGSTCEQLVAIECVR